MAATRRTSSNTGSSVLRPLSSSSQRLHHNNHHQQQQSSSSCNLSLRLNSFPTGNIPKPSVSVSNHHKTKCLCSPTTHPGSFRCAFHRRLEHEKSKTLISPPRRNTPGNSKTNGGLYLRKVALMNSLAKIGSVEAERFRRSLAVSIVKPSYLLIRRRPEFRPQLSRFYALHKDLD